MLRRLAWGISIHGPPELLEKQVYWVLISAWPAIGYMLGHGQDSGSHLWRTDGSFILCPGSAKHWHPVRVWEMPTNVPRRPIVTVV